MRKQFTFFSSFWDAMQMIGDPAGRLLFIETVCRFVFEDRAADIEALPESVKIAVSLVMPILKAAQRRSENALRRVERTKKALVNDNDNDNKGETEVKTEVNTEAETEAETEVKTEVKTEVNTETENDYSSNAAAMDGKTGASPPAAAEKIGLSDSETALTDAYTTYFGGSYIPFSVLDTLKRYRAVMEDDVIMNAFEKASRAGKTWSYARGILDKYVEGQVSTLRQAVKFDSAFSRRKKGEKPPNTPPDAAKTASQDAEALRQIGALREKMNKSND